MANLKTFSGFPIQNLSSDPVPFAQAKTNDPYGEFGHLVLMQTQEDQK